MHQCHALVSASAWAGTAIGKLNDRHIFKSTTHTHVTATSAQMLSPPITIVIVTITTIFSTRYLNFHRHCS